MDSPQPMLRARGVERRYASVTALSGVDLDVARGESVALMGASGSGKSTLLHLLGGLDAPTAGRIEVDGQHLGGMDDSTLSRFRRERMGFVFQFFHLLPTLTVLENVLLQGRLAGKPDAELLPRAKALLDRVGLANRAAERPDVLSGGQQQRVALARALLTQPVLILADEPTGNLDSASSDEVLNLLCELVRENGVTLVMATHSDDAARRASRVIRMKDGRIVADSR